MKRLLLSALACLTVMNSALAEGRADVQLLPQGRMQVSLAPELAARAAAVAVQVRGQDGSWQPLTLWNAPSGALTAPLPDRVGSFDLRVLVFDQRTLVETSTFSVEDGPELLTLRK